MALRSFLQIGVSLLVLGLGNSANAQTTAAFGCLQAPAALNNDTVTAFLASPPQLLISFPVGGLDMVNRVRGLAGTNGETIDPLLALASSANTQQRAAIGSGLARAAAVCVTRQPEFAALIQQKVADSGITDIETAFLAASGDVTTAALGAAGAGAGASAAPGITGNGPAQGGAGPSGGDISNPTAGPPTLSPRNVSGFGRSSITIISDVSPSQ